MKAVAEAVERGGMECVDEKLFVLDLGVKERELVFQLPELGEEVVFNDDELKGGALALLKARRLREMLDAQVVKSQGELARREQVSQPRITQLLNLLKLAPELQARILAGEFGYVSEHYLRDCVRY